MLKLSWKSLLVSPAILGTLLAVSYAANASEVSPNAAGLQSPDNSFEIAQSLGSRSQKPSGDVINKVESYSNEGLSSSADQVTSVSELRDVQPTEWAFEALRSLVERYGCIVGYPDRTFRGNRALTRWEFAAGLNACMNTMERLIQENVAVLKEDIDKLKRLMQEFEAELAALGARVDNLEGRVAFLEDHQFSTTTKLSGEVIFAPSWAFNGDFGDNQAVFQDRVRLRFNTSFTGNDLLVTRLSAGNSLPNTYTAPVATVTNDTTGEVTEVFGTTDTPTILQTWQNTQTNNNVNIDWVAYYAPISLGEWASFNVYIPAVGGLWDDFVPTLNPYFEDNDGGNGSLSTFSQRNPIYRIGGGAGIGVSYRLGFLDSILGSSSLSLGYLSGTANDPNQGFGLFNGNYGALAQINGNLFDFINIGFTYVNAYSRAESPIFGSGAVGDPTSENGLGLVGTELANVGGQLGATLAPDGKSTNSYGIQAAMNLGFASLSAFGSYTDVRFIGNGGGEIWTYGAGIAFPDLFKEGNVLGIFAGVQPYLGIGRTFATTFVDGSGDTITVADNYTTQNPVSVELFYKYQVTDNISVTPGIQWVTNPAQAANASDAWIGSLRGTFTF